MGKLPMPVICECGFSTMDAKRAVEHANKHKGDNVIEYTKGEWVVRKANRKDEYEIVVDVDISGETDCGVVADVYSCFTGVSEANAHLIAAAPKLVKALEKAREDINWMLNNEKFLNPQVFDYIDEVIDEAEGK